jgi:preprotein translocase subunit SecG
MSMLINHQAQILLAQTQTQSVIDRIPTSAAEAMADQGSGTFLIQIIYAAAIIWIVSLLRFPK